MTNTAFTPADIRKAFLGAINTRYENAPVSAHKDYKQIFTSIGLYPAEYLTNGIIAIINAAVIMKGEEGNEEEMTFDEKFEEIIARISITDNAAKKYIPQKGIDKIVRIAQFLGGARPEKALDVKAAKKRKGLIDSFVSLLFTRIAFMGQLPRNEKGQIVGKRPEVAMSNENGAQMIAGFSLSKMEFEGLLNVERFITELDIYDPAACAQLWAEGGQCFEQSTAATQVSQLRSTLTALGCATSEKHQKPSAKEGAPMLTMTAGFTSLVAVTVGKSPIPLKWMESPKKHH